MAKHHRSASRKGKSRKHRSMKRKTHKRRHGGVAPLNYSLAGDWSSRMSLGQGVDFFKYHEGQHGGSAPYPASVSGAILPDAMRGPAMIDGTMKAHADVAGLRDEMPAQAGGKRRKGGKKGRKSGKKSRKGGKKSHRRTHRKRRGGMASVNAPGMLLSKAGYEQAGLNPEMRGSAVEFDMAKVRDALY